MAFIHTGGTVIKKTLNNETLRMDTGCLVGFCDDIDYSMEMNDGLESMFFGGEGLFLATLSGSGSVWIQSMPFSMACGESNESFFQQHTRRGINSW